MILLQLFHTCSRANRQTCDPKQFRSDYCWDEVVIIWHVTRVELGELCCSAALGSLAVQLAAWYNLTTVSSNSLSRRVCSMS